MIVGESVKHSQLTSLYLIVWPGSGVRRAIQTKANAEMVQRSKRFAECSLDINFPEPFAVAADVISKFDLRANFMDPGKSLTGA
jgi:hypothetical protein